MKFEGKQVDIPIKGIMRAGTDNLSADGAMNEVIGMEYKDGSWLPYKLSDKSVTLPSGISIKNAWVHKISDTTQHYLLLSDTGVLYYEVSRTAQGVISVVSLLSDVLDVDCVGNALSVATTTGVRTFIWKDGAYDEWNIDVNLLPKVSFRVTKGVYNKSVPAAVEIEGLQYSDYPGEWTSDAVLENDPEKLMLNTMASSMTAVRGELRDRGGLTGYFLACYAFRLRNNTFVRASAPILLSRPMSVTDKSVINYDSTYENTEFVVKPDGSEVEIGVNVSQPKAAIIPTPFIPLVTQGKLDLPFDYVRPKVVNYEMEEVDFSSHPQVFFGTTNSTLVLLHEDSYKVASQTLGYEYKPLYNALTEENLKYNPAPGLPPLSCTIQARQADAQHADKIQVNAFALSNKLQFKLDGSAIEDWKDVQSLCLFISEEVDPYYPLDVKSLDTNVYDNFFCFKYSSALNFRVKMRSAKFRTNGDIIKDIKDINTLYLVREIQVEELNNILTDYDGEWINVDLEGILGDNLLVREQLPLTAFDYTNTVPAFLDSYNYRLHEYNYVQTLFKGYDFGDMLHNGGLGQYPYSTARGSGAPLFVSYKWEIKVEIKDEQGARRVVNYSPEAVQSMIDSLSPLVIYPDRNAESMHICLYRYSRQGSMIYDRELKFSHDFGLGFAYYIDKELKPILPPEVPREEGESESESDEQIVPAPEVLPQYPAYNINRDVHNGLKVSEVAYPSYFPTEYTYRAGNEEIIGLARLTIPVSQDNFGKYQLLLFCTDGIYTMQVNESGTGVYTSGKFLNSEVCVNRNTICEIGGAVIFASGKGLMIVDTEGVQEFSPLVNGGINFLPSVTPQYEKDGHHIYNKMITDESICTLKESLSHDDFIDYLADEKTTISYVSDKNMAVVFNSTKNYLYLIDIKTRNTTKLPYCVSFADNNTNKETYFEKLVNGTSITYDSKAFNYRSASGVQQCMFQSRPIRIQEDDKCSYRVVLTGAFSGNENMWAALVALGSIDGEHWRCIGVKNKKLDGGFHDFGCTTERDSWKYIMIIFSAELSTDSHIDSMCITADKRYNNKKR